jgi:hypothetical protein
MASAIANECVFPRYREGKKPLVESLKLFFCVPGATVRRPATLSQMPREFFHYDSKKFLNQNS